jgi:hypothetical protein
MKALSKAAKAAKKLVDSFDDKATNIAGRKTNSISVGKERQKRAKKKKKTTEAIAGGSFVEALGIPAKTLEQKEASTNSASKLRNTSRDIEGTPAEKKADKKKEDKKKSASRKDGGKVSKGMGEDRTRVPKELSAGEQSKKKTTKKASGGRIVQQRGWGKARRPNK